MKRVYSEPMVEKIAFNYRDQVVAASGDTNVDTNGNGVVSSEYNSCYDMEDVIKYLLDAVGICSLVA